MTHGNLNDIPLIDLLKGLSRRRRSGRLELRRESERATVHLREGRVYLVERTPPNVGERLGDRLVRLRAVDPRALGEALVEQPKTGERLGRVLLKRAAVSTQALKAAVRAQLEDAVRDLLEWQEGEFEFEPDLPPAIAEPIARPDRVVRIDPPAAPEPARTAPDPERKDEPKPGGRREGAAPEPQGGQGAVATLKRPDRTRPSPRPFRVVLVCTGNRFRSPLVEGLLRASAHDLPVAITSVGTRDVGALPALAEAVRLGRARGVDLSAHRAAPIRSGALAGADLVIGFERAHVAAAVVEGGASHDRAFTLTELAELLADFHLEDPVDPIERARRAVAWVHARGRRPRRLYDEIRDPLDGGRDAFRDAAQRLEGLTRRVATRMFGPPPPPHRSRQGEVKSGPPQAGGKERGSGFRRP